MAELEKQEGIDISGGRQAPSIPVQAASRLTNPCVW